MKSKSVSLLGARTLLGAPGLTTRNKATLLGAPGIATSNKKKERSLQPRSCMGHPVRVVQVKLDQPITTQVPFAHPRHR